MDILQSAADALQPHIGRYYAVILLNERMDEAGIGSFDSFELGKDLVLSLFSDLFANIFTSQELTLKKREVEKTLSPELDISGNIERLKLIESPRKVLDSHFKSTFGQEYGPYYLREQLKKLHLTSIDQCHPSNIPTMTRFLLTESSGEFYDEDEAYNMGTEVLQRLYGFSGKHLWDMVKMAPPTLPPFLNSLLDDTNADSFLMKELRRLGQGHLIQLNFFTQYLVMFRTIDAIFGSYVDAEESTRLKASFLTYIKGDDVPLKEIDPDDLEEDDKQIHRDEDADKNANISEEKIQHFFETYFGQRGSIIYSVLTETNEIEDIERAPDDKRRQFVETAVDNYFKDILSLQKTQIIKGKLFYLLDLKP